MSQKISLSHVNIETGQYEFVKLKKSRQNKAMNYKLCQVFQQLNTPAWVINYRRYSQLQYITVISMFQQSSNQSLYLDSNEQKKIVHLMMPPVFNKLIEMSLSDNLIDNLEVLQFINAPLLSKLDLYGNKISTLNFLKKTKFYQLKFINLSLNKIKNSQELQVFGRTVHSPAQKLVNFSTVFFNEDDAQELTFTPQEQQMQQYQDGDISVIFKPKKGNQISFLARGNNSLDKIAFRAKTKLPHETRRRPYICY